MKALDNVWFKQLVEAQVIAPKASPEVAMLATRWRIRKVKRLLGQD